MRKNYFRYGLLVSVTTASFLLAAPKAEAYYPSSSEYGNNGSEIIYGDWNGDGKETLASRGANTFRISETIAGGEVATHVFSIDTIPDNQNNFWAVVGDWDGDGKDSIGIWNKGVFYLKNDFTDGPADIIIPFGTSHDIPVAGDWDGDGKDSIGVWRSWNSEFHLKDSLSSGAADRVVKFGYYNSDDPVIGDWDGDGVDTPGIWRTQGIEGNIYYRNDFKGGNAEVILPVLYNPYDNSKAMAVDWKGIGRDETIVENKNNLSLRHETGAFQFMTLRGIIRP